ncbi:MAG: rhodanese-like domain-containing protein [Novosphingobium sp.]
MKTRVLALGLAIFAAFQLPGNSRGQTPNSAATPPELFDAAGYRTARYRAPVDRLPTPAVAIPLEQVLRLRPGVDALFIDVLPAEGGVRDPLDGTWSLAASHETIPGAAWHPETGRGHPDAVLWRGLRDAVDVARARRPTLPVVVFCRSDCWMSWNAARRLASEGFGEVYWFAEGIEGWHEAGRALVPARPAIIAP